MKRSFGEKIFDAANYVFMAVIIFITVYPFWYLICASFSMSSLLQAHTGLLWYPLGFTTGAYALTFRHPLILTGYRNILVILAVALPINIVMTLLCGYFLAARGVLFKKAITAFIMFTMFFGGGLIPTYLNMRSLGLYNNLWALIIPGAVSVYNSIIVKTAIEGVPESLKEAAYIDGANDIYVLFVIVARLILPTLAVMLLYYGVGHWNSWFPAMIYITDNKLLPLQAVLRAILIENSDIFKKTEVTEDVVNNYAETIKYSLIVVATLPVLVAYPLLQRYFVKGVMIGAVKG
ncbi:MAG: carbohydrate ABC transporter permease [Clostridiaceae bacterium]|nr:carbohydrate ABC transporter permease [Clostridiaceae bacterium]